MSPTVRSACYQIRLHGCLEERWLRWFEGLTIDQRSEKETVITGTMDQAALHGILSTIRDLGMELVSVEQTDTLDENQSIGSNAFIKSTAEE